MGRCYYTHDFVIDNKAILLDSFSECDLFQQKELFFIFLTARMKLHFSELLYYRFLYNNTGTRELYLVWDEKEPQEKEFQCINTKMNCLRFFTILKHVWKEKKNK